MHEALWVANQTDTRLNLNLSLDPNKAAAPDGAAVPTPVDPNTAAANPPVLGMSPPPDEATTKFVSNYNRFAEKFTGEMKDAVDRAMNTAWTGTQRYLEDNSFFAADPAPSAPAAAAPSNPSIEAGSSSSANGRPQAGSPTSSTDEDESADVRAMVQAPKTHEAREMERKEREKRAASEGNAAAVRPDPASSTSPSAATASASSSVSTSAPP
jgi:hypothetical protein